MCKPLVSPVTSAALDTYATPSPDITKLSHAGLTLRPSHAKLPMRGTSKTAVTTARVRLRPSSTGAVYIFVFVSPTTLLVIKSAMRRICFSTIVVLFAAFTLKASLLPPSLINAVAAIGHNELLNPATPNGPTRWVTEASGFFYGYLVQDDPDPAKRQYEVYLITNRHVIANHTVIFVRLNPRQTSDQGQVFDSPMIDERGAPTWFVHQNPNVDIAGIRINWQLLQDRGINVAFIASDTQAADTRKMQDIGVSAGDGIFVVGFPMNLAGQQRNYAIVRPGAIARLNDLIESTATTLLIDSHVFPGNSGGPVILEPNLFAINGTKNNNTAYLIGVVSDYISYTDIAVSTQTQRPRVTFEENSGLADVIPIDRVNEAIKAWRDSLPSSSQVPLKPASKP